MTEKDFVRFLLFMNPTARFYHETLEFGFFLGGYQTFSMINFFNINNVLFATENTKQ